MMKATYLENGLIGIATLVLGVMTGFFWTYTFNVNRAMLQVDGPTYATVQSLFNQNVRHAIFFLFFMGGGVFTLVALAGNWRHWRTPSFWLLATAVLVYIIGVIIYTSNVNLPLNAYTESWDAQNLPADWSLVRDQWNAANAVRVGTSGTAFVLALLVLIVRGSSVNDR
ncbi:MAG: DUF1772 domain-containing protein [Chloroflexota bacterium]